MDKDKALGIDELRDAVQAFGWCNENFCQRYTAAELLAIRAAWRASKWDFLPDQWTERQVREAIKGRAPTWDDDNLPTYAKRAQKAKHAA